MKFGIRPTEGGQDFSDTVEQVVSAEEYGIDSIYLGEHHGFSGANYWPSPLLGLAGIATRTTDIEIGTNISLLPLTNPIRHSEEIAMLDVISNGRVVCGFGIGWRKEEFETFNVPYSERGVRMTEYLKIVNDLLVNRESTFQGEYYSYENYQLSPRPVQLPRPKLYVGGAHEISLKRAVNLADGWMAPPIELDKLEEIRERFVQGGGKTVILNTEGVVVREDSRTAYGEANLFNAIRKSPHINAGNPHSKSASVEFQNHDEFVEYTNDRLWIIGDPDECIKRIDDILDRVEADEVILRLDSGWDPEKTQTTLDLLGNEVLPSFE